MLKLLVVTRLDVLGKYFLIDLPCSVKASKVQTPKRPSIALSIVASQLSGFLSRSVALISLRCLVSPSQYNSFALCFQTASRTHSHTHSPSFLQQEIWCVWYWLIYLHKRWPVSPSPLPSQTCCWSVCKQPTGNALLTGHQTQILVLI